jgi:sugar (pentulose or hexulose) kinase
MHLLSADIGTSSLKVVLFDEGLRVVAQARREYPTRHPASGQAEHDPEDWYRAFCEATRQLLQDTSVSPGSVVAVGVDGMSSAALAVDGDGRALRPAMIWLDRRATAEAERLRERLSDSLAGISGNRSDPSHVAPKLMWLQAHEPEVYRAAACFLQCNAYLVQRLTGAFTMDVSQGGLSLLCDVGTGAYSDTLLEAAGVDRRKLPEIVSCREVAGALTSRAARDTGLASGTIVVAGAMDNVSATLGMNVCQSGEAYVSAGTVVNVGFISDTPPRDGRALVYHHALGDRWMVNGGVDYGGAGLRWFRDVLDARNLEALVALAGEGARDDRALLFLPYMSGQRAPLWNEHASGVILGITPDTDRRQLVRMFMESVALGARHVFDVLGCPVPPRVTLTGGIVHSPGWVQIVADVMGLPLFVGQVPELSALGAAVLAGVGAGVFRSEADALKRVPRPELVASREEFRARYQALYQVYRSAYDHLTEDLAALKRVGHGARADRPPTSS